MDRGRKKSQSGQKGKENTYKTTMLYTKELNIDEIQALTEAEAKAHADTIEQIKGHTVYYINFPGYFGYSALVFAEGHHIYYANQYELHFRHMKWTRDELHSRFQKVLSNKLYTDEEIGQPLTSYDEYRSKMNYLHNYYAMRRDHETIFCINPSKAEQAAFEKRTADMVYDPIGFCYIADRDFVRHHVYLWNTLEKRYTETENDYNYMRTAYYYEMCNHEYGINWQADWDTLSAFGEIKYNDAEGTQEARDDYFRQLNMTDVQRKAYMDARAQYFKTAREENWY